MQAGPIISRVRTTLIDPTAIRWTDAELYAWLSDGQRTISTLSPSSCALVGPVGLVAGTRQQLPVPGTIVLAGYRNVSGRAIRVAERELFDAYRPNWHFDPATTVVTNWLFDPNSPEIFYVYPPNTGAGVVEMQYAVEPADVYTATDNLALDSMYEVALFDFVMYRALQKDDDFAAAAQADNYHKMFRELVTAADAVSDTSNPNIAMTGFAASSREAAK